MLTVGAACLTVGSFLISLIEKGDSRDDRPGRRRGPLLQLDHQHAVTALDPSRASLAGGIVYMFQVAGGSVGLGLATTVFTAAADDALSSSLARGGALAHESFAAGLQWSFRLVAALALAGLVVTVLRVGRSLARRE